MKEGIHPKFQEVDVTCACGNTFRTGSTLPEIKVEICSKCHPYFTGKQKFVDTAGRVDRFNKKYTKVVSRKKPGERSESQSAQTTSENAGNTAAGQTE